MTHLCRLYLITPPNIAEPAAFAPKLEQALSGGDVAALQIRLKGVPDQHIAKAAQALAPLAHARDVAVILNDRPDLAAALGCDGAHIGQEDAPYDVARRAVGPNRAVGVTCHNSRDLAYQAAKVGADYVAFGAFFPTQTKYPKTRADPELLTIWQQTMQTPCVAIGGITVDNARGLAAAGADFLAVCNGVWGWPGGPAAAVSRLNDEIAKGAADRGKP